MSYYSHDYGNHVSGYQPYPPATNSPAYQPPGGYIPPINTHFPSQSTGYSAQTSTPPAYSLPVGGRKSRALGVPYTPTTVPKPAYGSGKHGLKNIGNTCFLNSVIQCLLHTPQLINYIMSGQYLEHLKNRVHDFDGEVDKKTQFKLVEQAMSHNLLVKELANLMGQMWNDTGKLTLVPRGIKLQMGKFYPIYNGYQQHDADEFLTRLLEKISEAVSYVPAEISITGTPNSYLDKMALEACQSFKEEHKKKYSKLVAMFGGQYISVLQSISPDPEKRSITRKYDSYMTVSLPVTDPEIEQKTDVHKTIPLEKCFDFQMRTESIEGIKASDKQNKKMVIWKLPNTLVITLKRFEVVGLDIRKNYRHILFKEELNLSDYVMGYDKAYADYELYGVVTHYGQSSDCGHYVAFCKVDGSWFRFDDERVTHEVKFDNIVDRNAYILFFRRKYIMPDSS